LVIGHCNGSQQSALAKELSIYAFYFLKPGFEMPYLTYYTLLMNPKEINDLSGEQCNSLGNYVLDIYNIYNIYNDFEPSSQTMIRFIK
jgi:hypothetical protein